MLNPFRLQSFRNFNQWCVCTGTNTIHNQHHFTGPPTKRQPAITIVIGWLVGWLGWLVGCLVGSKVERCLCVRGVCCVVCEQPVISGQLTDQVVRHHLVQSLRLEDGRLVGNQMHHFDQAEPLIVGDI